mmetsp:Transcript_7622/g.23550  ORF Transcript_7622/g.23550 Transcript_7622/m.23550 type:complete len:350 (-) Transcript_7622:25-1074(-)
MTPRPASGDVPQAHLVIDRSDVHRVVDELKAGNTLYADAYVSRGVSETSETHWPFRAQWTSAPSTAKSTLFHRWLVLADGGEKVACVEHLNDIALDCRRENLRAASTTRRNVQTQHRLKYGYWSGGPNGAGATATDLKDAQDLYWTVVRLCPPLPDCVFAHKHFKKARNTSLQPAVASCADAERPPKRVKAASRVVFRISARKGAASRLRRRRAVAWPLHYTLRPVRQRDAHPSPHAHTQRTSPHRRDPYSYPPLPVRQRRAPHAYMQRAPPHRREDASLPFERTDLASSSAPFHWVICRRLGPVDRFSVPPPVQGPPRPRSCRRKRGAWRVRCSAGLLLYVREASMLQ